MKKANPEHRIQMINIRRGAAMLLAGCVLACGLAACGGDDKEEDSSALGSAAASFAPISTPEPTPAPAAKAAKITTDELNVRSSTSTDEDDNILGTVTEGDKLALMAETPQDDWYSVWFQGKTAYVFADYVEVVDVTAEEYSRLMSDSTPPPTETPDPDSAAESPAPDGATAAPTPAIDNEDGE